MDIMQLGAAGELIGGIAVLVTLIYLAVQVRDGAREQRFSSMREATREVGNVLSSATATPEQAQFFMRCIGSFDDLAAPERFRFSASFGHLLRVFEQLYYQHQVGSIDSEVWRGFRNQLHDAMAYPGVRTWWATRRHWYGDQFVAFVDAHVTDDNRPSMFGEQGTPAP